MNEKTKNEAIIVALAGPPGVGKSTLLGPIVFWIMRKAGILPEVRSLDLSIGLAMNNLDKLTKHDKYHYMSNCHYINKFDEAENNKKSIYLEIYRDIENNILDTPVRKKLLVIEHTFHQAIHRKRLQQLGRCFFIYCGKICLNCKVPYFRENLPSHEQNIHQIYQWPSKIEKDKPSTFTEYNVFNDYIAFCNCVNITDRLAVIYRLISLLLFRQELINQLSYLRIVTEKDVRTKIDNTLVSDILKSFNSDKNSRILLNKNKPSKFIRSVIRELRTQNETKVI